MLIMTQDRISGLAADKSPLKTFGPGNTQDDSNRNSWVSSDGSDSLSVNCFGQVNGLFLGRYSADQVLLTYQGDELFSNKTSTGSVAVGYSNGSSNLTLTSSSISVSSISGDYFYNSGTLVTITLSQTTDYVNVNDLVTISGSSNFTDFNGFHRIVRVQKDTNFTQLNSEGNSVITQTQGVTGNTIQVIISTDINDIPPSFTSSPPTLSIKSGVSIPIIQNSGVIDDSDDINFTYDIEFAIPQSSVLKSGDSPFTLNEFISFENVSINSSSSLSTVLYSLSSNYNKYYIKRIDSPVSFTVFVKPDTFYSKNLVFISTDSTSKVSFGSTFIYNGGAYQHRLGLENLDSSSSSGKEEFLNSDFVEISSTSINSFSISGTLLNQLLLNDISQSFLHKVTVKDRFSFSIRLPYVFNDGSGEKAFVFSTNDTVELRKYVLDTAESSTTDTGEGTAIRRANVATRTQNTVADFVQGKIIRVESNYIPLPREAFPTKIIVEMNSTLNHNAANLFNQFLLEELDARDPTSSSDPVTISDESELSNKKVDVSTFTYNSNGDGELVLNISGSLNDISEGDNIYLIWPNNVPIYVDNITRTADVDTQLTTFSSTTQIHQLYEGMAVTSRSSGIYINTIDKTANKFTTNINHNISNGQNVTLLHSTTLASEASAAWTGIHRVKSVNTSGTNYITIIVPNAGTSGDLTIPITANAQSAGSAYFSKVTNGKGRFVRPISSGITKADAIFWNSHPTDSVDYSYGSPAVTYTIQPGTAYLLFSSPHSLVNNDKIVIYDVASSNNGLSLRGLESSYLVNYSTSNAVTIDIRKFSEVSISSLTRGTSSTNLLVTTTVDHGFSVGERVTLNNIATYAGSHIISTVPTSKQFSIENSTFNVSTSTVSGGNGKAIIGVHYLSSFSGASSNASAASSDTSNIVTNLSCARSVSVAEAESSFENPIQVGNLIYRDGLQNSNSEYDSVTGSAKFSKTPNIDDATSTNPYRTDSGTAVQNTFTGTSNSVVSQISVVRGDATFSKDIQLIKPFGRLNIPFIFTSLLQGLKVAILRAGISRDLPNPQIGVTNSSRDFSVRKELPTGAYYYLNRASAKEFSGRMISTPENVDQLVDFSTEQLARPFPCLVISGNSGNIKKLRTRTSLYGYFTVLPQAIFNNKLNNLKEASFSIREVL